MTTTKSIRTRYVLVTLISIVALAGCATQLSVTYLSDPSGAMLYSNDRQIGYTPQTLTYEISAQIRRVGKVRLEPTRVQWASGAKAEVTFLNADIKANGLIQQFVFQRPDGIEGRDVDSLVALELQKLQLAQQQLQQAQAEAARRAYAQYWADAAAAYSSAIQRNRPMNCVSNALGNSVYTNCY